MKFTGPSWTRNLLVLLLVTGSLACTSPSYVLELESSSDTFYQLDDQIRKIRSMVALVGLCMPLDLQSTHELRSSPASPRLPPPGSPARKHH